MNGWDLLGLVAILLFALLALDIWLGLENEEDVRDIALTHVRLKDAIFMVGEIMNANYDSSANLVGIYLRDGTSHTVRDVSEDEWEEFLNDLEC